MQVYRLNAHASCGYYEGQSDEVHGVQVKVQVGRQHLTACGGEFVTCLLLLSAR